MNYLNELNRNNLALTPRDHYVLSTFVKWSEEGQPTMFPEYDMSITGHLDERSVLDRHGYRIAGVPPHAQIHIKASKHLLSDKPVEVVALLREELTTIRAWESYKSTKEKLAAICLRHGVMRYFDGVSIGGVSTEGSKESIVEALRVTLGIDIETSKTNKERNTSAPLNNPYHLVTNMA